MHSRLAEDAYQAGVRRLGLPGRPGRVRVIVRVRVVATGFQPLRGRRGAPMGAVTMSTAERLLVTRFVRRATIAAALIAAPMFAFAGPAFAAGSAPAAPAVSGPTRYHVPHRIKHRPVTAPATTAPATAPTAAPAGSMSAYEAQVVTLTNAQRVANGCAALRADDRLVTAARKHSADMVTKSFFSHTGSNGSDFVAREVGAGYPSSGPSAENIAWGYRTPQEVVTGWMNSPGHRANILNCSSVAVGVGMVLQADGTPYWTQDFGRI